MKKFSSLKWQILKKVILVHGIVALILTSFQLWVDYNKNLDSIKKNLSSSFEMFGPSISEALYHVNSKMMEEIFQGVLSQSDFVGVMVYDSLADEFITKGELAIDVKDIRSHLQDDHSFFHLEDTPKIIGYQHPINITGNQGEEKYFGNLVVFSNEELAFERIENTILIVFFNSLIKAMVLVAMFLLIFNRLLIQPLTKINTVIENLSMSNIKSLRLNLDSATKSSELYTLESGFNKLLDDLHEAQEHERIMQHQSKFIAIGEMVGNIAHQWRQPLTTANMIIAILLEKQQLNSLEKQYLQEKLQEIEQLNIYMSDTIENFLDFFNPDKTIERCNIKELIENSIEILKGRLEKNEIDVIINIPNQLSFETNKQELMQVLIILLSNSIDAISGNNKTVNKTIELDTTLDQKLKLRVKDYAGGIPKSIINRVFEPYFTTKHKEQGVGLGLYIAKMIIEKSLEGEIEVENHKEGAIFTITL